MYRQLRPLLAACLLAAMAAVPLVAQAPRLPAFVLPAAAISRDSTSTIRYPKTHWLEGARIGAVASGAFFAIGLGAWCQQESDAGRCTGAFVAGAVVGGLLGYGVGAFVGSLFPKDARAEP